MTQTTHTVVVTLAGKNVAEVIQQAENFIKINTYTGSAPGKRGRKAATTEATEDETLLASDDETTDDTTTTEDEEQLGFDNMETEDDPAPAPAPAKKATKITDKDVNAAAMKHAKKHGRPKTLALLNKHFKAKSILEIKPEQYAKALEVLKV